MDEEWVIELNKKLKRLEDETSTRVERQWKIKRSIYKVPPHMTDLNKEAYLPQVVSFGPYHHGEEHLMPMEEHKHRALVNFLKRTNMPLQIIVDNLTKVVQDLKDSYDLLGDVWQSDTERFLRLMVLDGCFMLEVLCYNAGPFWSDPDNYAPNDPIFSAHGNLHVMPYIRRDMLLLENQLPMRVLIELAAAIDRRFTEKGEAQEFLERLIRTFTNTIWLDIGDCLHVLDIFRKSMLWSDPQRQEKREHTIRLHDDSRIIVSAMELQEAGIRLKTRAGDEVTSYICFMSTIINSVRDVILLESNGVIEKAIGSEKAVVKLFQSLSEDIMYNPHSSMGSVLHDINVYRRKPWVKYRANFVHAYHVSTQWNPLAYWSIVFAILIFTLTLVQTGYTISPYYRPNK
ncbi:UPF0481 protein [Actinidia chinensis var. chinensis]|uniref:UPF0481 protein n=1 Tax=Actinidia chinensis var. chinensis TaxID=1590841 RepID=A0A2R6P7K6_ACTCC|nr:UPF0481 protein [Actinidia chinensis var. chinensis]